MSRMLKQLMVDELTSRMSDADGVVVVNFEGMTVDTAEEFRGLLAEQELSMTVVRNSLAGRACESLGMGPVSEILAGQVAFLYGGNEGVISVCRIVKDFNNKKKKKGLKIRGGFMEGTLLQAADVAALADMPTRTEMIGQVMAQILSAGGNIVSALNGPGGKLAGAIEKRADDLEKSDGGES